MKTITREEWEKQGFREYLQSHYDYIQKIDALKINREKGFNLWCWRSGYVSAFFVKRRQN